jgi:ABC-type polysaccharide/polyol phosphate export permease
VSQLTVANLKARYRKTAAGLLWVVLNPLILYGVQATVFTKVLHIDLDNYLLFLVSGLLPWTFISGSFQMGTSSIVMNGRLLKAYPVSPAVYLVAQILDNFINFLVAFALIFAPVWIQQPGSPLGLLLLPVGLLILVIGVFGMTLFLATTHVFFRDTAFLVQFMLSVAMFATPIFYPIEFVPGNLRWLADVNPLLHLIAPFRRCLYDFDPGLFLAEAARGALVAGGALLVATLLWRSRRNAIFFHL